MENPNAVIKDHSNPGAQAPGFFIKGDSHD